MTELILFYALLSVPVLLGLAYSIYSYRKFKRTKHRTLIFSPDAENRSFPFSLARPTSPLALGIGA